VSNLIKSTPAAPTAATKKGRFDPLGGIQEAFRNLSYFKIVLLAGQHVGILPDRLIPYLPA
jgi:hypothetical protein